MECLWLKYTKSQHHRQESQNLLCDALVIFQKKICIHGSTPMLFMFPQFERSDVIASDIFAKNSWLMRVNSDQKV